MLFFPIGRCGQGPMGPSSFYLLMASALFLLLAFPSAGVLGQDPEDEGEDPMMPTTPAIDTREGGGESGGGGGGGGESGKVIDPRHELFYAQAGNTEEGQNADKKYNYLCLKFGNKGVDQKGGKREFCGCVSEKATKTKPDSFHYPSVDLTKSCLDDFYKVAMMPMCGNEWFDQMKLCALTNFFDDKAPDVKGDKNKKTLLLIDGCAVCNSAGAQITDIKVTHIEEEAGGMFSNCKDEKEVDDLVIDGLTIDVPPGMVLNEATSSFSVPVVLYHRQCAELFGYADQKDDFKKVMLKITHTCGAGGTINIKLPEVNRAKDIFAEFQVAELRGLYVNLNDGSTKQYRKADEKVDGMLKYVENGDLEWEDANVGCWSSDKCEMK